MATPDTITVNLRVVGLFFSQQVVVQNHANLSVKDFMEAAAHQYPLSGPDAKPNGIDYRFASEGGPGDRRPSVLEITCNFDGTYEEFTPNGTLSSADGKSIGNRKREAGIYSLQELVLDPVVVAWQYYVIDAKTNENKSKTKPGEGFTFFSKPLLDAEGENLIKDGDTLIWRMVAIVRRPNVVDTSKHAA